MNDQYFEALKAINAILLEHPLGDPAEPAFPDHTYAREEGWAISSTSGCDNGDDYRLERLDEAAIFEDDAAAHRHVVYLAAAGSAYHKAALAFLRHHQPNEYLLVLENAAGM